MELEKETQERVQDIDRFSDNDYNSKGEIKKVRWHVLKKLMKYEFRELFAFAIPCMITLFALAVFCAIEMFITLKFQANTLLTVIGVLILLFYIIINAVLIIGVFAIGENRFRKNLFGTEGYLTHSLPVSAEEHVLAKHISTFVVYLLTVVVVIIGLSIFILGIVLSGNEELGIFEGIFSNATFSFNDFFLFIEEIITSMLGAYMFITVCGAATCFLYKLSNVKKVFIIVGVVFGLEIVVNVITSLALSGGIDLSFFIDNPVGQHISNLLYAIFWSAVTVGLYFYEVRYLKKKLNLV